MNINSNILILLRGELKPSETGREQGDNKRKCVSPTKEQTAGDSTSEKEVNIRESVQRGRANPSESHWRKHGLFELLGNFSQGSKWSVRNENKRKVHSVNSSCQGRGNCFEASTRRC